MNIKQAINIFEQKNLKKFRFENKDTWTEIINNTNFLPQTSGLTQRLWHIVHQVKTIPTCPICNIKVVKWNKQKRKYQRYCSIKCMSNDENIKNKKKNTCLEKYGVKHYTNRKKSKQTNLKRYGVENPTQNKDIKEKQKRTVLQKYNVVNISQSEKIKQKKIQTCIEHYGVEHPMYSNSTREKHQQTLLHNYGVNHPKHIGFSEALTFLNDKEWLIKQHINNKKTLTQISKEIKASDVTVGNYLHKHGFNTHYFLQSTGEKELGKFLDSFNICFKKNDRNIISPQELDIFIPSYNIAIEYCGLYWHNEQAGKDKNYHKNKLKSCNKLGIRLITLFEDEWLYKQSIVKNKIKTILNMNTDLIVYARKTIPIIVSNQTKKHFLNQYHIQGNGPGSFTCGLLYNSVLVACMTFIKQKNNSFVLNRYATSCRVVGGFSKLLKYFQIYYPKWNQIVSFADLRWSEGNLYEKTGFKFDRVLPPDYYYIVNDQRIHKFNFRHKQMKTKLPNYNPNLSEKQNMENHNIPRIYNCGLLRYVLVH